MPPVLKTEQILWKHLRKGLLSVLNDAHLVRIESGTVVHGVPDVYLKVPEHPSTWLELKVVKGNTIHTRTSQYGWHFKEIRAGGRVKIIASQHHSEILVCDGLEVNEKRKASDGRTGRTPLAKLSKIKRFTHPYAWEDILSAILEK